MQLSRVSIAILFLLAMPGFAHHSPSKYNLAQTVTVTGTLKKVEWSNPHVYIYIEETTPTGARHEWEIECFPPSLLRRMGWTKDTLRVGETLTARGSPGKNPKYKDLFPSVIKRGDRPLFALADALKETTPQPAKAASLNGVWSTALDMRVMSQAASPAMSTLTQRGVEARKRYDEDTSPTSHCIPSPPPLWMITPELKRVTLGKDSILIESEQAGVHRTIHLNGTSHEGALPSIQGHSIGRWEGGTLVVDTSQFAYHGIGNGGGNGISAGVPSGTRKHLIERFTPSADGASLTYSFELTDPEYLAVPRKGSVRWAFNPRAAFTAEKCDLEIARRYMKN